MCGIAGYVGPDRADQAADRVLALLTAQAHRGPDDCGLLVCDPREGRSRHVDRHGAATPFAPAGPVADGHRAILGCRRLAILDRSPGGHQPMTTRDGRYALVFNGEIYNYLELGRALEARGHRFRSRADTEVLLTAFAEWGAECLDRLTGMFAFAVLDTREQRLFLARDPFGIKPLYWTAAEGGLVFASEISALLGWPGISRRVAAQPLRDYLDRGLIEVGADTLFAEIAALPPAHCLEVPLSQPGGAQPRCYWRPDLDRELEISFGEAVSRLRELFLESVALHLRSDVPVGVLLSGGIDSSAVALAMRHVGGPSLDIHTFSYIGGQGAPSEEPWIDLVNEAAGAIPHKLQLEPAELAADLEDLTRSQDEPFGSIATYAQSRLFARARQAGVPVVLSGTGSDESLAGYEWFWPPLIAELVRRGDYGSAARLLGGAAGTRSPLRSGARTLAASLILALPPAAYRAAHRLRPLAPWIDPSWCASRGVARSCWPPEGRRILADRIRLRLRVGIPDLLRYEDRSSMAHSVEGRVPFLTRALVEFALALPAPYLMGGRGEPKHALREALRGIVPDAILERRDRIAFGVPVQSWPGLVPGLGPLLESLSAVPAVNLTSIREPLRAIRAGEHLPPSTAYPLWRLVALAAWARHFDPRFD